MKLEIETDDAKSIIRCLDFARGQHVHYFSDLDRTNGMSFDDRADSFKALEETLGEYRKAIEFLIAKLDAAGDGKVGKEGPLIGFRQECEAA